MSKTSTASRARSWCTSSESSPVSLDHQHYLGDTLDAIASENLDIESMLARARSMRLSVTLASQYPSQFDEDTLKSMQNNCLTTSNRSLP